MKKLNCEYCGREFETESRRKKYCTMACRIKANNEKKTKTEEKKCKHCGRSFVPDKYHREYCGALCLERAASERRKAKCVPTGEKKRNWTYSPKRCKICGEMYTPHSGASHFCSPECAAENNRRTRRKPKAASQGNLPEFEKETEMSETLRRFKKMSLREISAECARLHISYGQAQIMAYNGTLPESFGKEN